MASTAGLRDHQECAEEIAHLINRHLIEKWRSGYPCRFSISCNSSQLSGEAQSCLENPSIEFEEALSKCLSSPPERFLRKVFGKREKFVIKNGTLHLTR